MKKHAQKAKNHKISLFGKTVPTLALILVIAGGTAASGALLTEFGEVEGETDVSQSITINSNNVEQEDVSWTLNDVVAGEQVSGEPNTLNNNLDSTESVELETTVTHPDAEDDYSDSDTPYSAEYAVLMNGETFSNVEPNADGDNHVDDDEANAEYVYTDSYGTAVEASYTSETGHTHSGLWFNVEPTSAENVEVTQNLIDAEEDWIYVILEDQDGNPLLVGDFSPDDDTTDISEDSNLAYKLTDSDLNNPDRIESIEEIESRNDFYKDNDEDVTLDDIEFEESEVHYVVAATGTQDGGGESDSVIYEDVKFNDGEGSTSLIERVDVEATDSDFETPSGDHELGFAAEFDIAAYPGDYTFELEVLP